MNPLPSLERLRELLLLDVGAGRLFWRVRRGRWPAGMAALTTRLPTGYLKGQVDGINAYAHRVVWKMVHGSDPDGEIDHINGDRADNRPENLRVCPHATNQGNMRLRASNRHGCPGIHERKGRWGATVGSGSAREWLGTFPSKEAAVAARRRAERARGYHDNHGRTTR